ncbi:MAG: ribonuclease P protein subunit [Nitrososphaerota archaeon]
MSDAEDFLLPGSRITVVREENKATGTLLYETKNTLVVLTETGKKMYPKRHSLLVLSDGRRINGSKLIGRPAERLMRKN